ncbi:MAG: histidinol-phosphate transaminase [Candidatus Krumholzibacteriia bacterium]
MNVDLDKLARPFLRGIIPYKPGKPIEQAQREGRSSQPVIKLASNENPYPPAARIKQALVEAIESGNRYPESGAPELTRKLAKAHGVEMEEVFVANGTNEILDLLVRAYVDTGENCVFSQLSFLIYDLVCQQCGVGRVAVPCRDYTHDLPAMAAAINDKTRIVWICNPNNPTATYNDTRQVEAFLREVPDHTLVVLDEAYHEFVTAPDYPDSLALRRLQENLIVLRTFSKFYSLAGLRIGYALADPRVVGILHKMRQPFNVNRLAQAAAMTALDCRAELSGVISEIVAERQRMREAILSLGCTCPASQTNFLFVVPDSFSGDICGRLEEQGIIVRPMAPFGAPENSFRVNMGTPDENTRFMDAIEALLAQDR